MSNGKAITVSVEHRFYRYGNKVYTRLSFPYKYWQDYLRYFDEVVVVARVGELDVLSDEYKEASGAGVTFFDMPYFVGPRQMINILPKLLYKAHTASRYFDYFLLRSGNVSNFLWLFLFFYNKKYLREYPGNIKEGVEGVAGKGLVTRFLASFLHWLAKVQGKYSVANSFVSDYCADLYGSEKPGFVFSSFQFEEIAAKKISYKITGGVFSIVSVGRLEGEKGHADLIRAVSQLGPHGVPAQLHLVGDGRQKEYLQALAKDMGVQCTFHGSISNRVGLFDVVKNADIFVIPSHTEGMPRALLEAMAIGLPCIGTNVGGIPEVLSSRFLVSPSLPHQLAQKIMEFQCSEETRAQEGQANMKLMASQFGQDMVDKKKFEFWSSGYE